MDPIDKLIPMMVFVTEHGDSALSRQKGCYRLILVLKHIFLSNIDN